MGTSGESAKQALISCIPLDFQETNNRFFLPGVFQSARRYISYLLLVFGDTPPACRNNSRGFIALEKAQHNLRSILPRIPKHDSLDLNDSVKLLLDANMFIYALERFGQYSCSLSWDAGKGIFQVWDPCEECAAHSVGQHTDSEDRDKSKDSKSEHDDQGEPEEAAGNADYMEDAATLVGSPKPSASSKWSESSGEEDSLAMEDAGGDATTRFRSVNLNDDQFQNGAPRNPVPAPRDHRYNTCGVPEGGKYGNADVDSTRTQPQQATAAIPSHIHHGFYVPIAAKAKAIGILDRHLQRRNVPKSGFPASSINPINPPAQDRGRGVKSTVRSNGNAGKALAALLAKEVSHTSRRKLVATLESTTRLSKSACAAIARRVQEDGEILDCVLLKYGVTELARLSAEP